MVGSWIGVNKEKWGGREDMKINIRIEKYSRRIYFEVVLVYMMSFSIHVLYYLRRAYRACIDESLILYT